MSDIAKGVGDEWKKLARALEPRPFYRREWVRFEDGTDQSEEKPALRMLQAWKEEHKKQATAGRLQQALTDAGLQVVADRIGKPSRPSGEG